ncbi:hypothetical protein BD410DRAFT_839998 [Rickenella mellea]|uniref:Uncharacterized protein n=1 Tax=Rickenella mellea TaxID=50990 RepID=A0A4Y7Q4R6_9AGAM|nr:hypothetical protein BD410DRAFT_839998 [Rickenella mellea]
MAPPQDAPLKRLCGKPETLAEAQSLYHLAVAKTGSGSGYPIGGNKVGLPAICAYMASQRLLNNNDVSEKMAQMASCLSPKAFNMTLDTVRSAIAVVLQKSASSPRKATFTSLLRAHGLSNDITSWMDEVEESLKQSGELDEEGYILDSDVVRYMIFYWTCRALRMRTLKGTKMSEYNVHQEDFDILVGIIERSCAGIRDRIDTYVEQTRSGRSSRTSRSSSPSSSVISTPSSTSTPPNRTSPQKRRSVVEALALPSTPRKRQKVYSPSKLSLDPMTHTPTAKRMNAADQSPTKIKEEKTYISPSKAVVSINDSIDRLSLASTRSSPVTPKNQGPGRMVQIENVDFSRFVKDLEDEDHEMDNSEKSPPCRHRRPVFLDRQFYTHRDPRVVAEWMRSENSIAKRRKD